MSWVAFGAAVLQIAWINILLSGDNAVVIALASRSLPGRQRRQAMFFGAGAAILLRILIAFVISFLLDLPLLKVVGGVLLLWIAVKLILGDDDKPDAILVHAASLDALNPTIEAACAAGIVVISFSQVVTAPCPYKLNTNWDSVNHDIPVWLANVLGGKGKIIVDRGLPGSPISEASNKEIERVLAGFPGIEIVGWYTSNYALGDEQSGVASLLAANPQIDGILTAGYGTGAIQALKDAGRPLVPIVMFAYNGSATECATEKEPGLKCFIYTHPPYLSAEAIKLAVDILDGHPPASKTVLGDYPRLTTDIVKGDFSKGSDLRKLEIGVNVFPDLPPGLVLPASPDWVNITAQEAAGTGG